MKKQTVLVASRTLHYFMNEIPSRFKDVEPITVYSNGRVETKNHSYRYITDADSLRGFHGIKFEIWGPPVDWVREAYSNGLIQCAESL